MPYLWGKAEADNIVCNDVLPFPPSYRSSLFASVMSRKIDYNCSILTVFFDQSIMGNIAPP